jgi:hypothetical protein
MAGLSFSKGGIGQVQAMPQNFAQMVNATANVQAQSSDISTTINDALKQRVEEKKFNTKMGSLAKSGLKAIQKFNPKALPFEDGIDIDDMSNVDAMSAWEGFNQSMQSQHQLLENQKLQAEINQKPWEPSVHSVKGPDGRIHHVVKTSRNSGQVIDPLPTGGTGQVPKTVTIKGEGGDMRAVYDPNTGKYSNFSKIVKEIHPQDFDFDNNGVLDETEGASYLDTIAIEDPDKATFRGLMTPTYPFKYAPRKGSSNKSKPDNKPKSGATPWELYNERLKKQKGK